MMPKIQPYSSVQSSVQLFNVLLSDISQFSVRSLYLTTFRGM